MLINLRDDFMNKVSVIIPVYNRENYIIKCSKSIVRDKDVLI